MKKSYVEINQQQSELGAEYQKSSPNMLNTFLKLHKVAFSKGELDIKNKELIALGISIAARCDGCIAAHVEGALKAGAKREELIETIDVAILMGGGPAVVYGTQALAAIDELSS